MSLYQLERSFQTCRAFPLSNQQDTGVREARKPVQLVNAINNRDHSKTATKVLYNIA